MKIKGVSILACMILSLTISSASFAVPQASPAPVTAAQSAQAGDQLGAIRAACAEDVQKLCGTVQPGGGRVVACLKDHQDSLSDRCRQAAGLPPKPNSSSAPGSSGSSATPPGSAAGTHVSAPDSKAKSAPASKAESEPVTVAGERFVKRTLVDAQQGGIKAVTIHLPESWHFEGKIEWHYGWIEVPVNPSWHAENPANDEAYFQYESLRLSNVDVAPQYRQYVKASKPGDRTPTGQINLAPLPPLQAMALFIKKVRSDVTNLKWIGQQDLPDLAKALRLDPSPNQHGVAIKIGYDLNGKPVEEAFFGVYYLNKAGNQAVQAGHQAMAANQLVQTNWGFQALQSFRAPADTLDKRMPVYCLIAKSVQYEPQWTARYRAIEATLMQMFNQKLQQGWDQIRAADAISDQAVRNNEKFLDNIGRQEVAMRDSGGGSSGGGVDGLLRDEGGRSSSDHFSDLIRGVDTLNDPSTGGTKQLENSGGYNHFTDGFGNYRTYDNPNATPENQGENGSWTRMTEAP
jgi:Cysteine rich repeat